MTLKTPTGTFITAILHSVNSRHSTHSQYRTLWLLTALQRKSAIHTVNGVCINLPFRARAVHFAAGNLHKTGLTSRESSGSQPSARSGSAGP